MNEIIANEEELVEVATENVTTGSGKVGKVLAGVGISLLVGGLTYKFVVKPIIAKVKAKKAEAKRKADEAHEEFLDSLAEDED